MAVKNSLTIFRSLTKNLKKPPPAGPLAAVCSGPGKIFRWRGWIAAKRPESEKTASQTRRRLTSLVATREVWLGSITDSPTAQWLEEILRKEIAKENGFLKGVSYLIHDRGTIYGGRIHKILKEAGIRGKWLPVRSPDLNAFMESFVKKSNFTLTLLFQ